MSETRGTSGGPEETAAEPTKTTTEKKVEFKEVKEIKEFKVEKNEKIEKSEFKELKDNKQEKIEKNENKEHKDAKIEKLEKNEAKEHKDAKNEKLEKNEFKEHKDAKHEKIEKPEVKEFFEKPIGKEKDGKEIAEGPQGPGGPVEQRLAMLEQSVTSMQHFITSAQRPDLSRGALAGEPGAGISAAPTGRERSRTST
jgi:hypothetical protein